MHQELNIILDDLQVSFLTQEEKDFIAIYLRYYLVNYDGTEEDFDTIVLEINENTRDFLINYPNSEYISLFDSYELEPSKWSWGLGFDFGYSAKTGSLQEYFKNGGV